MKILICGVDGYIGWPLALHLRELGHDVRGIDNFIRRIRVDDVESNSATPIISSSRRMEYLEKFCNVDLVFDQVRLKRMLEFFKPDTIVHLAEQPSAPWSMIDRRNCNDTHTNNVIGTLNLLYAIEKCCPTTHLVKLGSMGEYGTPECEIPEGKVSGKCLVTEMKHIAFGYTGSRQESIETLALCPMQGLPFPRQPNSWYHLTKVHDSHNIDFACRNWGLRSTDIMQGVVFGVTVKENAPLEHLTRFDYDECFGTVINRFCAQAVAGHPITIYGSGGQKRGFLPLKDSIQCLTLVIENPPNLGEYRVLNQFEGVYSINELATRVCVQAVYLDLKPNTSNVENPRKDSEDHYYKPEHQKLFDMGYKPTADINAEIRRLLEDLLPHKDRIRKNVLMPKTRWSGESREVKFLEA